MTRKEKDCAGIENRMSKEHAKMIKIITIKIKYTQDKAKSLNRVNQQLSLSQVILMIYTCIKRVNAFNVNQI